jgi:co-chaperonin GroES (HSP10)
LAKALIGGQKTSEAGIIYTEKSTSKIIPAQVLAIGDKLTEDIQVGDTIWWDVSKIKDGYQGNHLVKQDWVEFVERN